MVNPEQTFLADLNRAPWTDPLSNPQHAILGGSTVGTFEVGQWLVTTGPSTREQIAQLRPWQKEAETGDGQWLRLEPHQSMPPHGTRR